MKLIAIVMNSVSYLTSKGRVENKIKVLKISIFYFTIVVLFVIIKLSN